MWYLCTCAIPDWPPDCTWMRPRCCHAGPMWEKVHNLSPTLDSQDLSFGHCMENWRRGEKMSKMGSRWHKPPAFWETKRREKSILKDAFVEVTFRDCHHIPEREKKSLKHGQEGKRGGGGWRDEMNVRERLCSNSCILQKGAMNHFLFTGVTTSHLQFKHGAVLLKFTQPLHTFTYITQNIKHIHHHKSIWWHFQEYG